MMKESNQQANLKASTFHQSQWGHTPQTDALQDGIHAKANENTHTLLKLEQLPTEAEHDGEKKKGGWMDVQIKQIHLNRLVI